MEPSKMLDFLWKLEQCMYDVAVEVNGKAVKPFIDDSLTCYASMYTATISGHMKTRKGKIFIAITYSSIRDTYSISSGPSNDKASILYHDVPSWDEMLDAIGESVFNKEYPGQAISEQLKMLYMVDR